MIDLLPYVDLTHIIVTAMLVAIIWVIQVLHYPTFRFIDPDKEIEFHKFHTSSISPIVAPLMVAELILVSLGLYLNFTSLSVTLLTFVIVIWLSTFLIQVPTHKKLSDDYNKSLIDRLIKTNWIRTICWTAKLVLMIAFFYN